MKVAWIDCVDAMDLLSAHASLLSRCYQYCGLEKNVTHFGLIKWHSLVSLNEIFECISTWTVQSKRTVLKTAPLYVCILRRWFIKLFLIKF